VRYATPAGSTPSKQITSQSKVLGESGSINGWYSVLLTFAARICVRSVCVVVGNRRQSMTRTAAVGKATRQEAWNPPPVVLILSLRSVSSISSQRHFFPVYFSPTAIATVRFFKKGAASGSGQKARCFSGVSLLSFKVISFRISVSQSECELMPTSGVPRRRQTFSAL